MKGSQIVIFVYDITSSQSFEDLQKWINLTVDTVDGTYVCGIVGNKNDLFLNAKVDEEKAREFAKSKGYKFKLVSALNDPKSFEDIMKELTKEYLSKGGEAKSGIKLGEDIEEKEKKSCCSGNKS